MAFAHHSRQKLPPSLIGSVSTRSVWSGRPGVDVSLMLRGSEEL
jgi:hypothetical protein